MCLRLQGLGHDRTVLHLQIDSILCPAQVWCHLLYSQRARFCHSKLGIESENFSIIELVWSLEKGYLLLLSINTHKENETPKSWLKTVLTTLSPHHCMVDPMKTRERIIYQSQNTGDLISSLTNINYSSTEGTSRALNNPSSQRTCMQTFLLAVIKCCPSEVYITFLLFHISIRQHLTFPRGRGFTITRLMYAKCLRMLRTRIITLRGISLTSPLPAPNPNFK